MGGEDHLFFRVQAFAETGHIDVEDVRGWLGPWWVGGWRLTPNQEIMRVSALYCAGVSHPDPLRAPRAQLLTYLRAQAAIGHQYLGPRTGRDGEGEVPWRAWQGAVLTGGLQSWTAMEDSWSEQDSPIYENFWLVSMIAAWRRASEIDDREVLAELERWMGHHAARLASGRVRAGMHVTVTPGARSSTPLLVPRSMAYHLLVEQQDPQVTKDWRDERASEIKRAVMGSGLPRFAPREDVRLKHVVRRWSGPGWSWQTCHGLPNTKPGGVATVAVGRPIESGSRDPKTPEVMWSRAPIDLPGNAELLGAGSGPVAPPGGGGGSPSAPPPSGGDEALFALAPSAVYAPARFGWLMDATDEGRELRDKAVRNALSERDRGKTAPYEALRRLLR